MDQRLDDYLNYLDREAKEMDKGESREQIYTRGQAERMIEEYVCAKCWGPLTRRFVSPTFDRVYCHKCGEVGLHSKTWVARQRDNDQADSAEVRLMLRQAGVLENPNKGKTEAQLLEELGFGG